MYEYQVLSEKTMMWDLEGFVIIQALQFWNCIFNMHISINAKSTIFYLPIFQNLIIAGKANIFFKWSSS